VTQAWNAAQKALATQPAPATEAVPECQGLVQKDTEVDLPEGIGIASVHRIEEADRSYQAGRCLEKTAALDQSFADQTEVESGKVTEPTVNQPRRSTRGAKGKIPLFDKSNPKSPKNGVPSRCDAGNPATDDQQVPLLTAQSLEVSVASLGGARWQESFHVAGLTVGKCFEAAVIGV
jgi:hypothetical protein